MTAKEKLSEAQRTLLVELALRPSASILRSQQAKDLALSMAWMDPPLVSGIYEMTDGSHSATITPAGRTTLEEKE